MAGTASFSVGASAYVSLGTGPMYITNPLPLMVVAATSQPAASVAGDMLSEFETDPFFLNLAEQIWGISPNGVQAVIVTT